VLGIAEPVAGQYGSELVVTLHFWLGASQSMRIELLACYLYVGRATREAVLLAVLLPRNLKDAAFPALLQAELAGDVETICSHTGLLYHSQMLDVGGI
jgi:hypothetical protein